MAGFLYFRSGDVRPLTRDGVDKLRLGYAFGASIECRQTSSGSPSGKPGVVFNDPARHEGRTSGYYADKQTWRKLPNVEGRPELWVGYWNDAKPGPDELARAKMLRGAAITLGDGNQWWIPVVRKFDDALQDWQSELPSAWACDDDGNLRRGTTPKAEYAHLWEVTAPLADAMFQSTAEGVQSGWPNEEAIATAVRELLKTNYSVDSPEIGMLEIVSDEEATLIVMLATNYVALHEWITQKKTNSPSTDDGAILSDGAAA